jgi:hypothetical protein
MPHMLDVGLSSTDRIASFFGIAPYPAAATAAPARAKRTAGEPPRPRLVKTPDPRPKQQPQPAAGGVQKVIEDALRSAGLMR